MNRFRFRFRPKAATADPAEKGAGFAFHALALAAGDQRQQKDEQDGKRQFVLTDNGPHLLQHYFVRPHWSTGEVPAVRLGIMTATPCSDLDGAKDRMIPEQ